MTTNAGISVSISGESFNFSRGAFIAAWDADIRQLRKQAYDAATKRNMTLTWADICKSSKFELSAMATMLGTITTKAVQLKNTKAAVVRAKALEVDNHVCRKCKTRFEDDLKVCLECGAPTAFFSYHADRDYICEECKCHRGNGAGMTKHNKCKTCGPTGPKWNH